MPEKDERAPKLLKLKETVEQEEPVAGGEVKERREVDRIIERLKKKEREPPRAELREVAERLLETKVEDLAPKQPKLDFKRVASDISFREQMQVLGKVYFVFQKPISSLAAALMRVPTAKNLNRQLEAANISLGVEAYLVAATLLSIAGGVLVTLFVALFGFLIEDYAVASLAPFLGILSGIMFSIIGIVYPGVRAKERAISIDKELPFALRQMATQVRAGLSFNKAMASVAKADYGELSVEMKKAQHDMESGATTEEALSKVFYRSESRGFKRALIQINRSLRTGGKLSEIISSIADDVAFETRMSIRDFTEVLNIISVVYIMVAVVSPVTLTVLSAVIQLPLIAANIPPAFIILAFMGIILGIGAIIFVTIRLEPTM